MPKLLYTSFIRLPTEKAHGLQIVQNCEAFADAGWEVSLWIARRWNTSTMRRIRDVYAYYGVKPNFSIGRVPCIDLMPLTGGRTGLARLAFYVQVATYLLVILFRVMFKRVDLYYSRDEALLYLLSYLKPKDKLVYEAHLFAQSGRGIWLQTQILKRCGTIVAITPQLRQDLINRGAAPERIMVAHDGIRAGRFANLPEQLVARKQVGWDENAFVVGFVGRLHMIGMDKGVGTLLEAIASIDGVTLALVGGPDDMAEKLREKWNTHGLDENRFLYAGHVSPEQVPVYLKAFDVCAMPHPLTPQFASYTSPLKLFEYMAARRAIIASDLPGWSDVVQHEESALLVPPSDVEALADAIRRLRDDSALRNRLANAAYEKVMTAYTWAVRAKRILGMASTYKD